MAQLTLTINDAHVQRVKDALQADDVPDVKAALIDFLRRRVRDYELDQALLNAALSNVDVT
jgi:hypothetical protein